MHSLYDLYSAWFPLADWTVSHLFPDGLEAITLAPLGEHVLVAQHLARSASTSANYRHRKLAAALAGWVRRPSPDLLETLLSQERQGDARLPSDSHERLYHQSVVEDIVFSATRWSRDPALRAPALDLLAGVVTDTLGGRYWNTSSYAITTLVKRHDPRAQALLSRFSTWASSSHIDHPSRPSLEQEKSFAAGLLSGTPSTLDAIDSVIDQKADISTVALPDAARAAIADFLAEVARCEAILRPTS